MCTHPRALSRCLCNAHACTTPTARLLPKYVAVGLLKCTNFCMCVCKQQVNTMTLQRVNARKALLTHASLSKKQFVTTLCYSHHPGKWSFIPARCRSLVYVVVARSAVCLKARFIQLGPKLWHSKKSTHTYVKIELHWIYLHINTKIYIYTHAHI